MLNSAAINTSRILAGPSEEFLSVFADAGEILLAVDASAGGSAHEFAAGAALSALDARAFLHPNLFAESDAALEVAARGDLIAGRNLHLDADAPLCLSARARLGLSGNYAIPSPAPIRLDTFASLAVDRGISGLAETRISCAGDPALVDENGNIHIFGQGNALLAADAGGNIERHADFTETPFFLEASGNVHRNFYAGANAALECLARGFLYSLLSPEANAPLSLDASGGVNARIGAEGEASVAVEARANPRGASNAPGTNTLITVEASGGAYREVTIRGGSAPVFLFFPGEALGVGRVSGTAVTELFGSSRGYVNTLHMDDDAQIFFVPAMTRGYRA